MRNACVFRTAPNSFIFLSSLANRAARQKDHRIRLFGFIRNYTPPSTPAARAILPTSGKGYPQKVSSSHQLAFGGKQNRHPRVPVYSSLTLSKTSSSRGTVHPRVCNNWGDNRGAPRQRRTATARSTTSAVTGVTGGSTSSRRRCLGSRRLCRRLCRRLRRRLRDRRLRCNRAIKRGGGWCARNCRTHRIGDW
jgi:hypothetical protein